MESVLEAVAESIGARSFDDEAPARDLFASGPAPAAARCRATLAYASSADGALALVRGRPTAISGAASLRLTHALRARHAAILVGVGTCIADDPRLSARDLAGGAGDAPLPPALQPRPVVLDPRARTPPGARLLGGAGGARAPVIVVSREALAADAAAAARADALRAAGAHILPAPTERGELCLRSVMAMLAAAPLRLRSVMVEGGAATLAAFVRQHQRGAGAGNDSGAGGGPLVDLVVATIAPTLFARGVHIGDGDRNGDGDSAAGESRLPPPEPMRLRGGGQWVVLGGDVVLVGAPEAPANAAR